ncbi:serine hydrolase [Lederbergia wuyishanensis]|uniref:CubicO group peptidase (Beta-lactamase class C family) n=1 Tax=Lederbergia wuyishanensis TaxID=1347903 RepID=A0ABU0D5V5_9BACI|nr:serine hydrolase domain-containing protein [Lederbergia wuyishanensis]MCJ8008356.1 beta-lactamase family protein [Lederbergia wuyishanensis]MDQ0343769.1 CubicO group peptidase (beta-lactamase class C family) [Lederbergia wuyishanensis]
MKILKWILITSLYMSLMVVLSSPTFAASSEDFTDIETFMDKVVQEKMEEFHIPNATISVVSDGVVIFEKGYGYADLNGKKEVDADRTLFRIGSTSKLFTWTAIMQLVEQGKLDLNADINQYLDFEIPAKLAKGSEKPQPITLTHLMTHTPGFEDYADSIFRLSSESTLPLNQYVRKFLPVRVFPAGEVVAYSNYGTALAGYIVEQVSGMPFSEYVEQSIYKPLGIEHSTFRQPMPGELANDLAHAYRYFNGEYHEGKFEFVPEPAGSMSSTSSDMARFMNAYLNYGSFNGNRILQEDTVREMFQQQFSHNPSLDGMALGFIEKTANEQRILFHGGSTTLFDSGLYLIPEKNIGVFISYSGNNFLTHTEILQEFLDHYFPVATTFTTSIPNGSKERSQQYVGEYHQNRKSFTTSESLVSLTMGLIRIEVDEDGYLVVTHNGEKNHFVEMEPGTYRNLREGRSPDAYGEFRTIAFETDPYGNIMLATDGPMTYSKAPWYASSGFTFVSIIIVVLLFLVSLIYWGIRGLIGKIKHRKTQYPKIAVVAKWVAITYGFLTLGLIIGVISTGALDPLYGLPKAALGILPSWSSITDLIPGAMLFLGIIMLILAVCVWWKKYWRLRGRLHYTILTIFTLNLLWIFGYWNLF